MCTEGVALGPGKAFYAFFSRKTSKPLKLKSKPENNHATAVGKTTFMGEKRCFLPLINLFTEFPKKFFLTLILFMRLPAIRQKKMNKSPCRKERG